MTQQGLYLIGLGLVPHSLTVGGGQSDCLALRGTAKLKRYAAAMFAPSLALPLARLSAAAALLAWASAARFAVAARVAAAARCLGLSARALPVASAARVPPRRPASCAVLRAVARRARVVALWAALRAAAGSLWVALGQLRVAPCAPLPSAGPPSLACSPRSSLAGGARGPRARVWDAPRPPRERDGGSILKR